MIIPTQRHDEGQYRPEMSQDGPVRIVSRHDYFITLYEKLVERYGIVALKQACRNDRLQLNSVTRADFELFQTAVQQLAKDHGHSIPLEQLNFNPLGGLHEGIQCKACGRSLSPKGDKELCSVCMSSIKFLLQVIYAKDKSR